MLDIQGHAAGRTGLRAGGKRDALDQFSQVFRHLADVVQGSAGRVGQVCALDHALRGFFHRAGGILGVGLDGAHQRADLLGGGSRAFGQALHFLGDDGKAAPRLAGRGGLDGGVQRQHVGLLGDVGNELGDFADFLRRFAQALDALGSILDLLADFMHALDGVFHRRRPLLRRRHRLACHVGRDTGRLRHVGNRIGHLDHGGADALDFTRLLLRSDQQLAGDALCLRRGAVDLFGRRRHPPHQAAQFLDRVVDGIGDGARDVFRHGGLHRQVAVGDLLQFVHQAQDGRLVLLIPGLRHFLFFLRLQAQDFRFLAPPLGVARAVDGVLQQHAADAGRRDQGQQHAADHHPEGHAQRFLVHVVHLLQQGQALAQVFVLVEDQLFGAFRRAEFVQAVEYRRDQLLVSVETALQRHEPVAQFGIARGRQLQRHAAIEQAFDGSAEIRRVAPQRKCRFRADAARRQELAGTAAHALAQHHQAADDGQVARVAAALHLERRDFLGLRQQRRRQRVQLLQGLVEFTELRFQAQDGAGRTVAAGPLLARVGHRRQQAGTRLADIAAVIRPAAQHQAEILVQFIAAFLELAEGFRIALHGVRRSLAEALRMHQRVAGQLRLRRGDIAAARIEPDEQQAGGQAQGHHRRQDAQLLLQRQMADQRQLQVADGCLGQRLAPSQRVAQAQRQVGRRRWLAGSMFRLGHAGGQDRGIGTHQKISLWSARPPKPASRKRSACASCARSRRSHCCPSLSRSACAAHDGSTPCGAS